MYIKETHSTSTLLREQYSNTLPHLYTIRTDYQTAGRGQAGNSWESEKGKNLLFSTLLRYEGILATKQWRLSMLVAVALWETLAKYLPQEQLRIKWPNDIYFGDKKLVGILIENSLVGQYVGYSIAGIGVNVNQTEWQSDAPNPISMKQITGKNYDVEEVMKEWISSMKSWETRTTEAIKAMYMRYLYRRNDGTIMWKERLVYNQHPSQKGIDGTFRAELVGISEQGELILRKENNKEKTYHFKQIRFVI